jgi:hypothetical protein
MRERLSSLSGVRHLAHPLVPKQSGYCFRLTRRVESSFTSNAEFVGSSLSIFVSVNRLQSFSGIRSISMADDLSQITSVFRQDLDAALEHTMRDPWEGKHALDQQERIIAEADVKSE